MWFHGGFLIFNDESEKKNFREFHEINGLYFTRLSARAICVRGYRHQINELKMATGPSLRGDSQNDSMSRMSSAFPLISPQFGDKSLPSTHCCDLLASDYILHDLSQN